MKIVHQLRTELVWPFLYPFSLGESNLMKTMLRVNSNPWSTSLNFLFCCTSDRWLRKENFTAFQYSMAVTFVPERFFREAKNHVICEE